MARGIALPAKLVRPIQAGTFQRTRLFRVLDARPITWVSGPPGSGKTTLAASYVEARRLRALWYQLDEADADVATLFFYLRQSALRASPTKRWRLPLLRPEYLSGLETFARRWFEELFAGMPPPFALVFDNYHTVPADSRFHEVLRTALETLPPEGRVIVTSRLGPPAAFARLCAEARMGFVEWDALRVTASEAAGIARARAARRVSRAEANALHAATDGWAAGVVLIVQRGSARNEETVPDRRPREAVFDYFASEVLAGSDDETKRVLLETALFTKITAAQAISLTGVQAASGILAGFAERRFFVDFHPEPEPTYQYHPLFREFLLSRTRDHLPAGRREQLRTIAADLLERSGQIEEAAELVRESNDHHRLAKIALAHAPALLATERGATLERWLSALPDHVLDASPWLLNWSAVCRMPFAAGACVRLATRAFERFGSDGDRGGRLFAASTAVDAILYHWMDFTELDRWIAALQQLLAASDPHSGDPLEVQAVAALFGALSWRCLEHPEIARWADRAEALWRTTTDVALRARLAMTVICYWISRGHVARSRAIFDELHASLPNDELELGRLWRIAVEATLSWHEADYGRSRRLVAKGLALAQTSGIRSMDAMLIGARAYCELIACDLDSAAKSLAEARASTDETEMVRIGHQHYLEGWKAFLDHDLPAAHAHAVAADRLAMQGGFGVGIIAARLALAQTLYERGEREEARL